jgi:hypothetical protein
MAGTDMTAEQRWTGWFYFTKEDWDKLSEKYRITMCFEELDLMQDIRSRPYQSEREKIICCARCPCKEPDCEDFCKHFQPTGDLMAVIKDGDLIESREALEHHFGRHDTCKSERTRCPLCREELRQKAGEP